MSAESENEPKPDTTSTSPKHDEVSQSDTGSQAAGAQSSSGNGPNPRDSAQRKKKPRKNRTLDLIAVASAVAAIASALTAYLAYEFSKEQSNRDRRILSIREIDRFEGRLARFGHPLSCVKFLAAVPDDKLKPLFNGPTDSIEFASNREQKTHLIVCLSGLGEKNIRFIDNIQADFESKKLVIEPILAEQFYEFTTNFINVHDDLVTFSRGDVAENARLSKYIDDSVNGSDILIDVLRLSCDRLGLKLVKYYPDLLDEVNKTRSRKVC